MSKREAREMNDHLAEVKKERDDALSDLTRLKEQYWKSLNMIETRDLKIKDQMEGLQALNRDLDAWEPLANLIASMVQPFEEQEITIPNAGINMLNKYRKMLDEKDQ